MGRKIGRNSPCPCGSGKKYKKCCLGTAQDPARSPELVTRQSSTDRVQEFLDHFFASFPQSAIAIGVEDLCGVLDRRVELLDDPDLAATLLSYFIFGAHGSALQSDIQSAFSLSDAFIDLPGVEDFWPYLSSEPLDLWLVEPLPDGHLLATELIGYPPRVAIVEDILGTNPRGTFSEGPIVAGWLVGPPQRRDILGIRSLPQATGERLALTWREEERTQSEDDEDKDLWILEQIVDPDGDFVRDKAMLDTIVAWELRSLRGRWWGRFIEALDVTPLELKGADAMEPLWIREFIASRDPTELSTWLPPLIQRALIHLATVTSSPNLRYYEDLFRELDPLTIVEAFPALDVAAEFGVEEDGALTGYDERALRQRPLRTLGLPPGAALWSDLHASAPIELGLEWADDRGPSPEAEELREAVTTARREARWWATWAWTEGDELAPEPARGYSQLLHAIDTLFDPRLKTLDLRGDLGLKPALLRRVQRGLARATPKARRKNEATEAPLPPLETIADLPRTYLDLISLEGVGDGTVHTIFEAIWRYARSWRQELLGATSTQSATSPEPASAEAQAKLSSSLDDLAALFDG